MATAMSLTVCAVSDSICRSVAYCTVQTTLHNVGQREFRIEILALVNIAQPWILRSLDGRVGLNCRFQVILRSWKAHEGKQLVSSCLEDNTKLNVSSTSSRWTY